MSLYKWFNGIVRINAFWYILILVILVRIVTLINVKLNLILALVLAVLLIYYYQDQYTSNISDLNRSLEYKLNSLPTKPQNFHIDADLIDLFYSVREFYDYHPDAYSQSLKNIDQLLEIEREVLQGVDRCRDYYQIAMDQYKNALNHFHSIIYSLPPVKTSQQKFKNTLDTLQLILRKHTDKISYICSKSKSIMDTEAPFSDDPSSDQHFTLFV